MLGYILHSPVSCNSPDTVGQGKLPNGQLSEAPGRNMVALRGPNVPALPDHDNADQNPQGYMHSRIRIIMIAPTSGSRRVNKMGSHTLPERRRIELFAKRHQKSLPLH